MSSYQSSFTSTENPLRESAHWQKPGSWGDLQKNSGAEVVTANVTSAVSLASPSIGADQYSEITFDAVPQSDDWPAVQTRVQSGANGSCYLVIVFVGQLILYRTDDTGSLGFTQLATANITVASPFRLRMESTSTTHKVYFNGTLYITQAEATYSSGQPGIAIYDKNGDFTPKILTFDGGDIGGVVVPQIMNVNRQMAE